MNKLETIEYIPGFVSDPTMVFNESRNKLDWKRVDLVPRREYYSNESDVPYTYGTGQFARTYEVQPWHEEILNLQHKLNKEEKIYDVCFLNGYENSKDQLGWHADDSPEMDHKRPIAIISLGAEREIWFKEKEANNDSENIFKLKLQNGSLCIMKPGMQLTHLHRIPKADNENIGPRISLTFRGYVNAKC